MANDMLDIDENDMIDDGIAYGRVNEIEKNSQRHRAGRRSQAIRGVAVPPRERLMTVAQLAEAWQVSQRTIRRMIADGRLPVRRIGRAVVLLYREDT